MESHDRVDGHICVPLLVPLLPGGSFPKAESWRSLGFFPKLTLLIPNTLLVAILLRTYPAQAANASQDAKDGIPSAPPPQVFEGTAVWQANLQGIQNLMGFAYVSAIPRNDRSI